MRPQSLQIEGFTCYRERQPVLDLSSMSLFAIAGPTGAGKSTLLDAILYALYGMVPRIGKHGIGEFVSHGRNVLSVALEFALQGRRYRLMRSATKSSKGQLTSSAALAEITATGERSIADTVKTVNERIEQLLGLGFEAFTQTVILPQNEFAKFLQSPPKDRRGILQHLLRHQVYEEMRRRAERGKDLLASELASMDGQLDKLKGATPEALEALIRQLEVAKALVIQRERDAKKTAQALADLKGRRELTIQLQACVVLAQQHEQQAPGIEKAEAELKAARAAGAVSPRVEAVETAATRVTQCTLQQTQAGAALAQVEGEHHAAVEACESAKKRAAEVPGLRKHLERLAEISGDLNRRPHARNELQVARGKRDDQAKALAKDRATLTDAEKLELIERRKVEAAEAALDALNYDPAALHTLDPLREDATVAENLTKQVQELEGQIGVREGDVRSKAERLESLRQARDEAASALEQSRTALQAAADAKSEGERRHAAASIQAHLHVGDRCPVCERVVSELPTVTVVPELEVLAERWEVAATKEERFADGFRKADRAHHNVETALEHARAELAAVQRTLVERREALAQHLQKISEALMSAGALAHPDVLTAFRALLTEGQTRERNALEAAKGLAKAEKGLHTATLKLQAAQAKVHQEERALSACDEEVIRLEGELKALEARITAVTSAEDPVAERLELGRRIQELESDERDAASALGAAAEKLASAKAASSASLQAKQEADEAVGRAQLSLDDALQTHGFKSADAVKSAQRSEHEIRVLESSVREFGETRAANRQRLIELEPKIAGREVQEAAVVAAVKEAEDGARRHREALTEAAALDQRVTTMTERVGEAQRLGTERSEVAARHAVTAEMAGDLRTDGFQTYLLEEAFKALVSGASERLYKVSRRYTMECNAKGEFYVLDHDNAAERRRAETLSGGETFMASLCLALQLSDEVLRASGAIRMDSLFIDEGFGTLDVDSLSEVTDALEAIRDDGDRMIGIISHRPELTDRLPGCVVVEKGVGESRWLIERIG